MVFKKSLFWLPVCIFSFAILACGDSNSSTEPQDEYVGKWRVESLSNGDGSDTLELYNRGLDEYITLVTKEECSDGDTVKAINMYTDDVFKIVCNKKVIEILNVFPTKGDRETEKTSEDSKKSSSSKAKNRSSSSYYDEDDDKVRSSSSHDETRSSSSSGGNYSSSSSVHTFTKLSDKFLNPAVKYGEVTDSRDNQTYKTVQIGIQTWMAQNLNFDTDSSTENKDGNGRIYNWVKVIEDNKRATNGCDEYNYSNVQGICPVGWHLPSKEDWMILINYVTDNSDKDVHEALLAKENMAWSSAFPTPTDEFGFSIVVPRYISSASDEDSAVLDTSAQFLTSICTSKNYGLVIGFTQKAFNFKINSNQGYVRCIKDYNVDSLNKPAPVAESVYDSVKSTLTDLRDNQVYKTTQIGDQVWMAENLNYVTHGGYADDGTRNTCLYSTCEKYGRYYQWTAAMDMPKTMEAIDVEGKTIQGICPKGWHIPNMDELDTLLLYLGGIQNAAALLADTSINIIEEVSPYGFNFKPGNYYSECTEYKNTNEIGYIWSTKNYNNGAMSLRIDSYFSKIKLKWEELGKLAFLNVRCLRDERSIPHTFSDFGTFKDERDDNTYRTVEIGNDTWMADNMNFVDESELLASESWCYNDSSENCETFGRLYSWDAATLKGTAQGICPDGWHVSTREDWENLIAFVDNDKNIGLKLKSSNMWDKLFFPDNEFGFSALPGGYRDTTYHSVNLSGHFWTSNEFNATLAYYFDIESVSTLVNKYAKDKTVGRSVRCVKD